MTTAGPLSLGQLSVWHDIRDLSPARRHEPNNAAVWALPPGTTAREAAAALTAIASRHPSLRTRYDLHDADAPRQWVEPPASTSAHLQVTTAADRDRAALDLARHPFDLGREQGWRAQLFKGEDGTSHLLFVKHHILADAWAQELLRRDLLCELAGAPSAHPPAEQPGPLDLAREQHAPAGLRRRRAALNHWAKLLAQTPHARLPHTGTGPGEVVQATLRSTEALAAARTLGTRAQASVAGVVLAAWSAVIARRCDTTSALVQLMSANRFAGRWKDLVTSMNQWVPTLVEHTDANLVDLARTVHWSSLAAVRHGMYDVTEVAALRARTPQMPEPICAFNHVTLPPAAGRDTEDAAPTKATVVQETPFTTIGPRCYARSTDSGHTLSVRLTATDVGHEQCTALLWELHDTLLAAAREPAL
ncbi:condensation domain-containing protein [Streptomyces sp. NPDC060011]|uniref:condensation domain-containing protein n=1 Tax=Streptomyces sp. NPDC060011 TaxID=3347037 RepID=UPI0036CB6C6D